MTASPPAFDSALLPAARAGWILAAGLLLVVLGAALRASGLDPAWMLWAHRQAPSPAASVAWSCLTIAGLGWSALILVLAADRGQGRLAAWLLPAFLLGGLFTHLPKIILPTARPAATALLPHLHIVGDALRGPVSMPSGHALTAAATAVLVCSGLASGRRWLGVLAALAALLVGVSRVAVGAHWPSDVVVGTGLGMLASGLVLAASGWRVTGAWLDRLAGAARRATGQRVVAVVEFAAAAGLMAERTGYPAGAAMVALLAGTAAVSAAWRWRATLRADGWPRPSPESP